MPRYKLLIEYDGTPFVGWQKQSEGLSVQGLMERAVQQFAHETPEIFAAGRTDAGVHALGQVAHVDLHASWIPFRLRDALNYYLKPHPIAVLAVEEVDPYFHARFSAQYRAYIYRIFNRYAPLTLDINRAWRIPKPLDVHRMQEAAQLLTGTHDFSAFRASECQASSPIKTLDRLEVHNRFETIEIYAQARSFLHHQVRNLVGALVWVGQGKWTIAQLQRVLMKRNRCHGAPTAPACGLYFLKAVY
jgi:tRNA pseudouridine38-40 synthase